MKRFLLGLIAVFILCYTAQANQIPINILYVHGSDQGTQEEFDVWINRLHPDMNKNLSKNELFQKNILQNAYIKNEPEMLYWADKPNLSKSIVTDGLTILKKESPWVSQKVRSIIAYMLHDAIWLQRYRNIRPIRDDLNEIVIANYKKGEKTILSGYSAGSLITYQYLLNKAQYLEPYKFISKHKKDFKVSKENLDYLKQYANEPTCIDALIDSKIAIVGADGGLIQNPNVKDQKNNIKKLKKQTQISCIPNGAIVGVINFGSPLVVFYSDLGDNDSQIKYFTSKMSKYIVESGQFFLTVNFNKDPIGIPINNKTYSQISQLDNIKNNGGFLYHTSVRGGINVAAGHFRYWDTTNHFSKQVAKSYETGYNLFYSK